jgi:hypothetical protein
LVHSSRIGDEAVKRPEDVNSPGSPIVHGSDKATEVSVFNNLVVAVSTVQEVI